MTAAPVVSDRIRGTLRQFMWFSLIGGSGIVVNMVVTVLMNRANGGSQNAQDILFPFIGTPFNFRFSTLVWIVAFLVAVMWNFVLNRYWTFGGRGKAPFHREFFPFLMVGAVAAFAGIFIKVAFTNPTSILYLPEPHFHEDVGIYSREYWAQLFTIVLTMPINFAVNKVWTFRAVRRHHEERQAAKE